VSVEPESAPRSLPGCPSPAVVVNPIHVDDLAQLHTQIARVCTELEWTPPLWLQTTIEDPGEGQARIALAAGADVVLACGGDGTVRHVARVLAGSGTPLGLVPTGTANLLARNLAIGSGDPAKATRIALCGTNRAVDVGWVLIDDRAEEQVFMVMAGVGFDAEIMAGASHELKARLGPLAYFLSGARADRAAGFDHPCRGWPDRPAPSSPYGGSRQLRKLLAGLVLMAHRIGLPRLPADRDLPALVELPGDLTRAGPLQRPSVNLANDYGFTLDDRHRIPGVPIRALPRGMRTPLPGAILQSIPQP
jgi:diacylglycerol kinase-like protein